MRETDLSGTRLLGHARDHFDWTLFMCAAILALIGVINLYSATSVSRASLSEVYIQQVYWLVSGGILAMLVTSIDYRHYEKFGYALYAFGIVLLVLVFVLGKDIRGSSRWIYIGSFSLQPSEFMKLFLIIAVAKYLHDDPRSEGRTLRDLLVRSDNLYRRIARLDDVLFGTPKDQPGVKAHFDRLNQAFGAQ